MENSPTTPKKPRFVFLRRAFRSALAGTMAGGGCMIVGHPFDTVKVRIQMSAKGIVTVVRTIWKKEGAKGFYKGAPSVISTVSLINAVVFTAYEQARRFMGVTSQEEFTFKQGLVAGGYAGLVNCICVCPQELVKCKRQ